MPRRRPSQRTKSHSKPRPIHRNDSKLKRWDTLADIELDEEDQFHASRDRILLDEGEDVDADADEEEEVFALQGVSYDSDEDSDEAEDTYEVADDEQDSDGMHVDSGAHSGAVASSKSKSKLSKSARAKKSSPTEDTSDSEEEEETWGSGKGAYYSSNAAQLDSDDEEANELEEQEAIRLQAKAREALCDDDFGLGDVMEVEEEPPEATVQELPVAPPIKAPQDKQAILRALEKESPETLALARDWDDTAHNLVETKARVEALQNSESDALELSLQHMYYQALLTYATTLAFYLHMRATEKYAARPELLRRHPILKRLLTLKEGINTLESLGVGQDASKDDDDDDGEDEDEEDDLTDEDAEHGDLWSLIKKQGLESGELAALLEDAGLSPSPSPPPTPSKKADPTKKERLKKKHKTPAVVHGSDHGSNGPVFDLIEPEYTRASRKNRLVPVADTVAAADPYGEFTALQRHDMSDKQARKKSLRFYVSRIESSSSRRTNARAHAIGGDDDIPYRERKKEREARLERERERRKEKGQLGAGGDDLDDADPEISEEKKKPKRKRATEDEDADADDAIGYYDLVKQATAIKKARKKAEYEAAVTRPELELESTSGPRSITRAILKNKGLTPHRSKAVRNPRVKKRQKYDQAKKRVASQKAVYKGGIGDVSKYSGEQSGISKVVKSVRL